MFFNDFEQFKNKSFGIKTKFDKYYDQNIKLYININIS